MYGVGVDVDRQLQSASARLAHAAPVLKRVAHEQIRRYGGDGLVEVLHLDSGERHFPYISVGAILVHGYPVARTQHVVGRKLHAGHKTEDGILENQHDDSSRSAKTGKHGAGTLVDDDAHHEDEAHHNGHEVEHLIDALQRPVAQLLVLAGYLVERMKKLAYKEQRHHHEVDVAGLEQHGQHTAVGSKGKRQQDIPQHGRYDAAEGFHHTVVEQIVVPCGLGALGKLLHCRHDNIAEQRRAEIRNKTYGKQGRERIYPRQNALGHTGCVAEKT